jgi:hypothetical protein
MDFSNISLAALKKALPLVEKRESILAELRKVEAALAGFGGALPAEALRGSVLKKKVAAAESAPAKPAAAPERKPASTSTGSSRVKRGGLGERVISILKAAGAGGVAVSDIASALAVPAANLHVWFSTTGRKNPAVQKADRGVYVWKEEQGTAPKPTVKAPVEESVTEKPVVEEPVAEKPVAEELVTSFEPESEISVDESAVEAPAEISILEVAVEVPTAAASVMLDLFQPEPVKSLADDLPIEEAPAPRETVRDQPEKIG